VPALCVLACGCFGIFPVPTAKHTPKKYGTRGEIEKRGLRFLKRGTPTRSDVLLNLGEPDLTWHDDRYFAYRWITVRGKVAAWDLSDDLTAGGDTFPMGKKRHDLVFEFGGDGTVRRHADIRRWSKTVRHDDAGPAPIEPQELLVLQVRPRKQGGTRTCSLRLGETIELREESEAEAVRIDPRSVRQLRYQSKRDLDWKAGKFHCRLLYTASDGRPMTLRFDIDLTYLPTVIDYFATCCHAAKIAS
jgi:hypothetical protein